MFFNESGQEEKYYGEIGTGSPLKTPFGKAIVQNGRYYVITSYHPSDDDWRYHFGYFTTSEELFDKVIVDNFLWFRHTLDSVIIEIVDCF